MHVGGADSATSADATTEGSSGRTLMPRSAQSCRRATCTNSCCGDGRVTGLHHRIEARARRRQDRRAGLWPERLTLGNSRRWICSRSTGRVLEVCVGTGLNLPHYSPQVSVTALDLDPERLAAASVRAAELRRPVALVRADAARMPFGPGRLRHRRVHAGHVRIREQNRSAGGDVPRPAARRQPAPPGPRPVAMVLPGPTCDPGRRGRIHDAAAPTPPPGPDRTAGGTPPLMRLCGFAPPRNRRARPSERPDLPLSAHTHADVRGLRAPSRGLGIFRCESAPMPRSGGHRLATNRRFRAQYLRSLTNRRTSESGPRERPPMSRIAPLEDTLYAAEYALADERSRRAARATVWLTGILLVLVVTRCLHGPAGKEVVEPRSSASRSTPRSRRRSGRVVSDFLRFVAAGLCGQL